MVRSNFKGFSWHAWFFSILDGLGSIVCFGRWPLSPSTEQDGQVIASRNPVGLLADAALLKLLASSARCIWLRFGCSAGSGNYSLGLVMATLLWHLDSLASLDGLRTFRSPSGSLGAFHRLRLSLGKFGAAGDLACLGLGAFGTVWALWLLRLFPLIEKSRPARFFSPP